MRGRREFDLFITVILAAFVTSAAIADEEHPGKITTERVLESAEEMLARHPGFLSEATLDLGYWARERRHEFMRLRLRLPTDIPLFPGVKNVRFVIDPSVTGRPRLDGRHNFMFKPVGSLIWRVTPNLTLDLDIGKKGGAKPVFGLGLTIRY